MIQQYIVNKKQAQLVIFFTTWGFDATPFADYVPKDADLMICYDFRNLDFDFSLISGYESIKVVAWSFGVWAADQTFYNSKLPFDEAIAFNGTLFPVDDSRGVSATVLENLVNTFSAPTLKKYFQKICGTAADYEKFSKMFPKRKGNEMRAELVTLIRAYMRGGEESNFYWDKAVIGSRDAFFLPSNQTNGWDGEVEEIENVNAAHYSDAVLRRLVCGE